MSCEQLHQTFKNISPPVTNQYGIDFFKYAETTGSWIVIFPNKFMNMFGPEDYIKAYFNYFEPLGGTQQQIQQPSPSQTPSQPS